METGGPESVELGEHCLIITQGGNKGSGHACLGNGLQMGHESLSYRMKDAETQGHRIPLHKLYTDHLKRIVIYIVLNRTVQ